MMMLPRIIPRRHLKLFFAALSFCFLSSLVFFRDSPQIHNVQRSSVLRSLRDTFREKAGQPLFDDLLEDLDAEVFGEAPAVQEPIPPRRAAETMASPQQQSPPRPNFVAGRGKRLGAHVFRPDGLLEVNPSGRHPIYDLIERAQRRWQAKLDKQSTTLLEVRLSSACYALFT